MSYSRGAIRMVCNNPNCINKSIVFRKEPNFECKSCGQLLSLVKNLRYQEQDKKAKADLKRLGL